MLHSASGHVLGEKCIVLPTTTATTTTTHSGARITHEKLYSFHEHEIFIVADIAAATKNWISKCDFLSLRPLPASPTFRSLTPLRNPARCLYVRDHLHRVSCWVWTMAMDGGTHHDTGKSFNEKKTMAFCFNSHTALAKIRGNLQINRPQLPFRPFRWQFFGSSSLLSIEMKT